MVSLFSPAGQRALGNLVERIFTNGAIATGAYALDYVASISPLSRTICTIGMGLGGVSYARANNIGLGPFSMISIPFIGLSYGIAWLLPADCEFTVFTNMGSCIDLLVWGWRRYVTLDRPSEDLASEGGQLLYSVGPRLVLAIGLHGGRPLWRHLTRNLWDYDKPSAAVFVGALGTLLLWARLRPSRVVEGMFKASDFVRVYDWKMRQALAWVRHSIKWKIIKYAEAWQKKRLNVEDMEMFTYSPLDASKIRLLRLPRRPFFSLPGLVELEIIKVGRNEHEQMTHATGGQGYEAISYTWGPREPQRDIIVEGRRFTVGPNLYTLLHARRSIFSDRIMWIDAICINQEDKTEQAKQVRVMDEIYTNASRVVSWLGDQFDASLGVHRLLRIWGNSRILSETPIEAFWAYQRILGRADLDACLKLIRNDYFSRAWILQEVVLGRKVEFYVAGTYISWDTMSEVVVEMGKPQMRPLLMQGMGREAFKTGTHGMRFHDNVRTAASLKAMRSLMSDDAIPPALLLCLTAGLQSTVPVDKVFCLLGLTNSPEAKAIHVDYKSSTREVFEQIATVLLQSPDNADLVLSYAGIGNLCDQKQSKTPSRWREDLPSWVPDWECTSHCHRAQLTDPSALMSRIMAQSYLATQSGMGYLDPSVVQAVQKLQNFSYCASKATDGTVFRVMTEPVGNSGQEVKVLLSYAMPVDSVGDMTRPLYLEEDIDPNDQTASFLKEWDWLREVEELAEASLPDSDWTTGRPRDEMLWRTLMGDRTEHERPAPAEYAKYFAVYRWMCRKGNHPLTGDEQTELKKLLTPDYRGELDPHNVQSFLVVYDALGLIRSRVHEASGNRRFAVTTGDRAALVPPGTEKEDVICLMPGIGTPMILREVDEGGSAGKQPATSVRYQLVGECYVHGIMDGGAMGEESWCPIAIV